jgi:hypothetical protein
MKNKDKGVTNILSLQKFEDLLLSMRDALVTYEQSK